MADDAVYEFDADPTPVNEKACEKCGRSTDIACVGCGGAVTVVVPCDPPRREILQKANRCILSPGNWFFCINTKPVAWFCVQPNLVEGFIVRRKDP
jgi:hypothetical protein